MSLLTVAICSYNKANRLSNLIAALRAQECPIPFEILVVDNNSTDKTKQVVKSLSEMEGIPLKYIKEDRLGIVHARNCAIEKTRDRTYLAFIDDDELPGPDWLKAAVDAFEREGADCVGGEIKANLPVKKRLDWLEEELLGFLGEKKYSTEPFWIVNHSTPLWSGNIAYRTSVFAYGLRYDPRYNRKGQGIGGGEDAIMFDTLVKKRIKIRYRPDMVIDHFVEEWKLKRRYFLKLHFIAGIKFGRYATGEYERVIMGIPPFMMIQVLHQWGKALLKLLRNEPGLLRQAMNGTHAIGSIVGRIQRWRDE